MKYMQRCVDSLRHASKMTLLAALQTSCVSEYFYSFEVENMSDEAIVVTTASLSNCMEAINVYCSDPSNYFQMHYKISDTLFVIPPHVMLEINSKTLYDDFSDTPEQDGITPPWKFIRGITSGEKKVTPEVWNSEQKWSVSDINGAVMVYTLNIWNEDFSQ